MVEYFIEFKINIHINTSLNKISGQDLNITNTYHYIIIISFLISIFNKKIILGKFLKRIILFMNLANIIITYSIYKSN
jgi:hypothetical protein